MKTTKSILIAGILLAGMNFFTSCEDENFAPDTFQASSGQDAQGGGKGPGGGGSGGNGGGGGGTESTGNNLSFPVIWSEGVPLVLRPALNGVQLGGDWWYVWGENPIDPSSPIYSCNPDISDPCYPAGTPDVYKAYLQKDAANQWQASNFNATDVINVDAIDWGDNLESSDWSVTSKVRTEVVLYENLVTPVTEYAMRHVSGWGIDEVHGLQVELDGDVVYGPGTQATVFSPLARLTIQQLTSTTPSLTWDASVHAWTGDVSAPLFNKAVYEAADGPGYYNGEVNVKGKVIYGYTWDVKKLGMGPGTYRITFSFDQTGGGANLNTFFDSGTTIMLPVEEVVAAEEPGGGGTAVVDATNNLTFIDVNITAAGGGKGGGKKAK
ncbi:hypothetical protein [Pontibacter mangrovi]|uniref:Uncharacterized protein n=1 Tax=Pontibacter mangrovi TaxID=2589816 RepID=A0A501WCH6_9BACT|nr:hypothetical protein [Pontibacter mangrovi]TPE46195.1 hypothetical protein FJM65_02290 [Pontibacter mangrovi]